MIGRTIGKYRIVGQLGRGGMGTVYRAIDETLDREVAIKVLNPELADSDIIKRFRAEATTLAKLNHPEIATLYELFRSDTDLLMVMEFVRGETLDKLSDRVGLFPPDRAAYLIDKVLSALEHAHRAGIVHRDMKPANVMVTEFGGVKIMDFGIARVRGAEHMTIDGYMMGTPAYMPPEQVLGKEVDGRADLYSVGVVFYRLLTGTLPFKADTAIGMVQKQISETPTPLRTYREGLPDWCETILQRALAKSPSDRFQSAEEFRTALGQATGMLAIQHTRAFSTADLEMTTPPEPMKVERVLAGPAIAPTILSTAQQAAAPPVPLPVAAPVQPSPVATKPQERDTVVLRRAHLAVLGSLIAILAIALAAFAYVNLARRLPSPPDAGLTASASAPAGDPAASNPAEAAAASPPSTAGAAAPPSIASPPPAAATLSTPPPATASVRTDAPPTPAATDVKATPAVKPSATNRPPSGPAADGAAPSVPLRLFVPVVFGAKAFVVDDEGRAREQDAQMVLADGRITVTPKEGSRPLHDVLYGNVLSISYSQGRDPLWSSPAGPAPVARAGGGTLGIFRGERHWISVQTNDRLLVVRLESEPDVRRVIAALEERTGRPTVRVSERKDAK
jgi:serine/threonine-protein kinase